MNNNARSNRPQEGRPQESRPQENRPEVRQSQGNGQPSQQNRQWKNDGFKKEGQGYKSYNRDNRDSRDNRDNSYNRDSGYRPYNAQASTSRRIKTEETIEDIRADFARIEKEIELEIKQISSMRLGV